MRQSRPPGSPLRVMHPPGTRFQAPVVSMLASDCVRRGWARPFDFADPLTLRKQAEALARLLPLRSSAEPARTK